MQSNDVDHPANQSVEDYLATELFVLLEDVAKMRHDGSWQAVVAGTRLAMSLRKELDAVREAARAKVDPSSLEDIVCAVLAMPDEVFRHPLIVERVQRCS